MELFIPIESMVRRAGGLSVVASLRATPFMRKVASEWTEYRSTLREAGRQGAVGSVPQLRLDGDAIAVQAVVSDEEATKKFLSGVLRRFAVSIDENSGQATMITAIDNLDERVRDSIKLYKRGGTAMPGKVSPEIQKFLADRGFHPTTGRMLDNNGRPVDFTKKTYATTGTSTDSSGPGAQYGVSPEAMATAEAAERFAEELITAITQLGEDNEDGDLSPAEVLRQAIKIAAQRAMNATDMSDGPEAQAQVQEAQHRGEGGDFNNSFNLPSGFELAKRMNCRADDGGLFAKLSREDRVAAGGLSASLLKSDDVDLRKFEDGSGDADTAKIITEPDDLLKRLSARRDFRQPLSISVFNSAPRADEFRGSYSPGLDGLPLDAKIVNDPMHLVAKLSRRHARGGEDHLAKLLH